MISDELIQADLIAKLKSITSVTAITGVQEVRELQWQGDTFTYPNIRLDLEEVGYEIDEGCALYFAEFSIYVFSQERTSKQCSQLKGRLENSLTSLGFTGQYAKYNQLRLLDNVPAVRQDSMTWRSQIKYRTRLTQLP